jgi:hypothetical protein
MAEVDDHPLTGPRVGAALGLFGPLGIGVALMTIALPHLNGLFWLGFMISLLGGGGVCWVGHSEIQKKSTAGLVIGLIAILDIATPFGVLVYAVRSESRPVASVVAPEPSAQSVSIPGILPQPTPAPQENEDTKLIYPPPPQAKKSGRTFAHFETLEQMLQPYKDQTSQENQEQAKVYIGNWVVIEGHLDDVRDDSRCKCTSIFLQISRHNVVGIFLLFYSKKWKSETITMHKSERIEAACAIDALAEKFVLLNDCELIR